MKKKIIIFGILILLLAWYGIFLAKKIDLTTADLGRHLKNGEMILDGNFDVLKKNLYSYTYPDYPFVNHHWASGAIFYIVKKFTGLAGLSWFFIIVSFITFLLFFNLSKKIAGFRISAVLSLLLIPLIASRTEIRPEIFTYLFAGIFFWTLWQYRSGFFSYHWLFVLPVLEILWINLHIYFILGILIIGAFLLESAILFLKTKRGLFKESAKRLFIVFICSLVATFFNPAGLIGALHPFRIYRNYGYRILEEQPVWFLERLGFMHNPNFLLFKIVFLLFVLSFAWALFKNRRNFSIVLFCLGIGFSIMGWFAIRNFALFGFFILPIIADNIKKLLFRKTGLDAINANITAIVFASFIVVVTIFTHYNYLPFQSNGFGVGLAKGNEEAANFLKQESIKGPILNNYDIGGYLIYYLYPEHKVFIDNRPEVYPSSFFKEIYILLQENEEVWQEQLKKYNFNAIFFSYRDATPWAQKFLIERVSDPAWAPVFADNYAIIFLKRDETNRSVIGKHEIPRERFGTVESD